MGMHEGRPERDHGDLPARFAKMCVEEWQRRGLPPELIGPALFAAGVNSMLQHDDPAEVADVLFGIAAELSPAVGTVGHA